MTSDSELPSRPTPEALLAQASWLRGLARSLVAEDEVDDVCQEALLAALRGPPREPGSLRAWCVSVVRKLAAQVHRGHARRVRRERRAAHPEALPSTVQLVERVALQHAVVAAVLELSEPYRSAVLLRFFEELPPLQIAQRLHAPVETVRTWQKRGLALLRRRLDGEWGDRKAWVVPFAGLARIGDPLTVTGAAAPLTAGALTMGIKLKVALALGVLVSVAALWRWLPAEPDARLDRDSPTHAPAVAERAPDATPEPPAARTPLAATTGPAEAPAPRLVVIGELVDEETLAPIEGAEVVVASAGDETTRESESAPRAQSDARGAFRIEDRRERGSPYESVLVQAPGRALLSRYLDPSGRPASGTVDLGRILVPFGTTLSGRVLDGDGGAVSGARVFLSGAYGMMDPFIPMRPQSMLPQGVLAGMEPIATTDAAGRFASGRRFTPHAREHVVVAVGERGIGHALVALTRNRRELADVEVRLRPNARVEVRTRDEAGQSIAGAHVRAEPRFLPFGHRGDSGVGLGSVPEVLALFTGASSDRGVADLQLPVGEGGVWGDGSRYDVAVSAGGFRGQRRGVHVDLAAVSLVQFTLLRDVPVRMTGVVRGRDGAAIAGARVAVQGAEGTSDAAGGYVVENVRSHDGSQHATVSARGYRTHSAPVRVPQEESSFAQDFTLEPAAVLTGFIVNQKDRPVRGVRIALADNTGRAAESAADGSFRIEEAPLGDFLVVLRVPELPGAPRVGGGLPTHTVNAAQSPVRLVLEEPVAGSADLTIEVVGAHGGEPLDPGRITFRPVGLGASDAVRAIEPHEKRIGHVRWRGVRTGGYLLGFDNPEGYCAERIVTIEEGQDHVRLRVELAQPPAVDGRVVLDGVPSEQWPETLTLKLGPSADAGRWARPPGDPDLELVTERGWVHLKMRPSASTRFRIEGMPPGREAIVTASGLLSGGKQSVIGEATVRADPQPGAEAILRVAPPGQLALRFKAPCPVDELMLHRRPASGGLLVSWRISDLKGRSERNAAIVPAGPLRWRIDWIPVGDTKPRSLEGEVVIEAGKKTEIVVEM